ALRGVVGRLLEPAVVERQRLDLAVFEIKLAIVGAVEAARDDLGELGPVQSGAVDQGRGGIRHQGTPASLAAMRPIHKPCQDGLQQGHFFFRPHASGGGGPPCVARWWRGLLTRRFTFVDGSSTRPAPPPPPYVRYAH